MRIAVVGCGAMGSVYAGLLAAAGHDVWAVDPWDDHLTAIRRRGLRVEGASGDRTVALAGAVADPAEVADAAGGPVDLVILATKVGQVTEAAAALAPILGPDTPVLSIQNGLGGPQRAAAELGPDRVLIGVVGGFGASMTSPGHVHHNGMELVRIGEFEGPGAGARAETVAEVWRGAGFPTATYDDVHQLVWEKLLCNVAFSGPCTVTGLRVGQLLADPDASALSAACATEAFATARATGIRLDLDDPVAYTRTFGARIPDARPSMLLDHLAGRRSEIDAINGAIPDAAGAVGLEAPANAAVAAVVRARERHHLDPPGSQTRGATDLDGRQSKDR